MDCNGLTAVTTSPYCPFYMKAIIYCRVSTKEQVENFSLGSQEKACRDYAKHNNFEVDSIFVDEGESAKTTDRPQFLKMVEYCKKSKGKIQAVIVYNVSRFARNQCDHFAIRGKLKNYGARLISVTEPFDDSAFGHAMEGMSAVNAQWDNETKSERAKVGLRAMFESGKWCWGLPLGYKRIVDKDGKKKIVIDEDRAPLIVYLFTEYAKGSKTQAEILRKAIKRGLRTLKGNLPTQQLLEYLLRNKFYTGVLYSKKHKQEVKSEHPALIDLETFLKVQRVLSGKTYATCARPKLRPEYPLRGFVDCPVCFRPLTASITHGHGGEYHYYHCYSVPRHKAYFAKDKLETAFQEHLSGITAPQGRLQLLKAVIIDSWESKRRESGDDLRRIENQMDQIKTDKAETIGLVRRKVLSEEDGKEELERINRAIEDLTISKGEASGEEFDVGTAADKWARALRKPDQFWLNLKEVEQKVKFQSLIFPEGITYQNPGFGTSKMGLLFALLPEPGVENSKLVHPEGVGPSTSSMSMKHSTAELRVLS